MHLRLAGIAALTGLLAACEVDYGDTAVVIDGLATVHRGGTSNRNGIATFTIDVTGESAMLVTFQGDGGLQTFVAAVYDPSGALVLDGEALANSSETMTGAVYLGGQTTLNWPMLDDQELTTGTWTVEVGVTDLEGYYQGGAGVTMDSALKSDADLDGTGTLGVDVIYVGPVSDDVEAQAAMIDAIAYWRQIYAQIGIELVVSEYDLEGPETLFAPGLGSEADYASIAEQTDFRSVNLVVVGDLDGMSGLYGLAGGIPGPLVATGNSAVAISVATNAGPDLAFDQGEIGILGETLAHEVGHFLGLSHPVQATFDSWDALDDTPQCSGYECDEVLGANLMYPYPVCDGDCVRQGELTPQQGRQANRYTAVE